MTMTITEKVAYLKGLADGLDLDKDPSKEGKLISKIIDILEDIGLAVEDLEEEVEAIDEELEAISEDLADVEDMIFEDYDDEDDDDDEDECFEVTCPNCDEPLIIDDEVLAEGVIQCPNCEEKFSLDLSDDTCTEEK